MVTGSSEKDSRIQKVVRALTQDPTHTLPELANTCQISRSRLSHLFKNEIGIGVGHYCMDCRLRMAAVMLISSDLPIKGIACATGYRHSSSFVRAFNAHFGLSPASYRKKRM